MEDDGSVLSEESQLVRLIIEDTQANEDAIAHIVTEYQDLFAGAGVLQVIDENIDTSLDTILDSYNELIV